MLREATSLVPRKGDFVRSILLTGALRRERSGQKNAPACCDGSGGKGQARTQSRRRSAAPSNALCGSPELSSCSLWLSLQTARFSRKGQLPWCSIFPSSFCEPRRRSIHLRPLLGFQREPRPGPCDVDKNISDSWTGACSAITRHSAARSLHISAVSMAVPGRHLPHSQKKTPPRTGESQRGFNAWQVWGLGHLPSWLINPRPI